MSNSEGPFNEAGDRPHPTLGGVFMNTSSGKTASSKNRAVNQPISNSKLALYAMSIIHSATGWQDVSGRKYLRVSGQEMTNKVVDILSEKGIKAVKFGQEGDVHTLEVDAKSAHLLREYLRDSRVNAELVVANAPWSDVFVSDNANGVRPDSLQDHDICYGAVVDSTFPREDAKQLVESLMVCGIPIILGKTRMGDNYENVIFVTSGEDLVKSIQANAQAQMLGFTASAKPQAFEV